MKSMENIDSHLRTRLADLEKAKGEGRKIVGYMPGGYLPEELVLACGAIPMGFVRGGDHSMVEGAGAYICRWIDPFWRAQIGYGTSGEDPYYGLVDLMTIPVTDNHVRAVLNILSTDTELDIFSFGVPHTKDTFALDYYLHGITELKGKLERLTGVEITESRLKDAIGLCNRERELFRKIALMRKNKAVPIGSEDFVKLNHASFIVDKEFMVEVLESLVREIKGQTPMTHSRPRILLTGSTLAQGDTKVLDLTRAAGGEVVIEEFAEGIRPYWVTVDTGGDLLQNLAQSYFMDRVCPGWFRPGTERLDFLIQLAKDFAVKGMIWYQLMYRESYKVESFFFPDMLKRQTGLPMLTLESDYDAMETGQMQTRIETFIETIRSEQ